MVQGALAQTSMPDLARSMSSLGVLVLGMLCAFLFHILVFMSGLSWALTHTNPYQHIRGMGRAMALAMGCASSAVTLPTNILCCEEMGMQPSVARFVLSLGATVSMDGTAIYIPSAIVWLAAQQVPVPANRFLPHPDPSCTCPVLLHPLPAVVRTALR